MTCVDERGYKECPIRYATTSLTDLKLPMPGTVCPAK